MSDNWQKVKACRPPLAFENDGWAGYAVGLEQAGDELEAENAALGETNEELTQALLDGISLIVVADEYYAEMPPAVGAGRKGRSPIYAIRAARESTKS